MGEPSKSALVVVAPSIRRDLAPWHALKDEFERRQMLPFDKVDWLIHDHRLHLFGRTSLEEAARELDAVIADQWRLGGGYDEVILVGHSMGALVARKAWLNCVDRLQGPDHSDQKWGRAVSRFVLFAGISRGVDPNSRWSWRLGSRLFELVPGEFTFESGLSGSRFITNLRISWMRYLSTLGDDERPAMVQLLGTRDDLVSRMDSIDLDAFPDDRVLSVAGADHGNLHDFRSAPNPEARLRLIAEALIEAPPEIAAEAMAKPPSHVVMIVHGIRASRTNSWIRNAEEVARALDPQLVVERPTYGYLSALRFVLPPVRKRYARYFRDFYTQAIARHRPDKVSILCHSNGTYAVGRSLQEIPAIRLDRLALAGSVLPCSYDWEALIRNGQIEKVRNDGGSRDVPVAILCSALRGLRMRDIGTAGFDGFLGSCVEEVRFHDGGHSVMLERSNLESMVRFLLGLDVPPPSPALLDDAPGTRRLSRLMPYLPLILVLALLVAVVSAAHVQWLVYPVAAFVLISLLLIFLDIF